MSRDGRAHSFLIGRDTRESGAWIEEALTAGIAGAGGNAVSIGILPTAAVAYLVREGGFDAGIMISASHNPYHDNGIKVFSADGYKLPDADEARIESMILDGEGGAMDAIDGARPGRSPDLIAKYHDHLVEAAGAVRFDGMRIVLDCANGAASEVGPRVFEALGAEVHSLSATPDGRNINAGCGSQHPGALQAGVVESGAVMGFAFDGDADRCVMVDDGGGLCDGDFIMFRSALALKAAGRLGPDMVVGTVMSNLWLERSLSGEGIRLLRTPVGDKYVLEEMIRQGARIGGEQSGHVIFLDHATTGDGLLTAVMMAASVKSSGASLSAWRGSIRPCPQILLNIRVVDRPELESHPVIGPAIEAARRRLGADGRVLLRYSGTEPLARVMVEAVDGSLTEKLAGELAELIRVEIGERP
jgi:phosphoglucosamine mutase